MRGLQSWRCAVDISRCADICYLVNDNEVGVVHKLLFAVLFSFLQQFSGVIWHKIRELTCGTKCQYVNEA